MCNNQDTSKQPIKTVDEELDELKEMLAAISETTSEGFFIFENGYCVYSNNKGCEMVGYCSEELVGMHATLCITDEYMEAAQHRISNNIEGPIEMQLLRKDGTTFFAELRSKNRHNNGKDSRVVIIRDISDYKLSLQKLTKTKNKYQAVIENAGDGIITIDKTGCIIEVNDSFLKMTGFAREELQDQDVAMIYTPESLEEKPMNLDSLDLGETIITERSIRGKNGENIPVEMNSKKPDENYYLSIVRDLRERKKSQDVLLKINEELRIARDKAEESDLLKSSFLTNMSHEVRTPMNGIIGFTELLQKQDLSFRERQDYLNIILSSGQQLISIINDVLTVSEIETNNITLDSAPFDILSMIKDIIAFYKPMAELNHNTLSINTSKCNLAILSGDPAKIQQVITNLLNNSLKFTQNGKVEIGIVTHGSETMFYVKDTGIGIPEQYHGTIFNRFTQVQHPGIHKTKGSGIGLSICKKLVDIMNGNIWLESSVNNGSTFSFAVPFLMV